MHSDLILLSPLKMLKVRLNDLANNKSLILILRGLIIFILSQRINNIVVGDYEVILITFSQY